MSKKIKLYVSNTVTYISDRLPSDVYQGLRKVLGYRPEAAVFKIRYGNKHWDGIESTLHFNERSCKCSIKKKGTHFPTGLFNKARDFLVSNNIELEVYDIRDKVEKNIELEISDDFELRDYQGKVIEDAFNMQRGIVKSATGSGKSAMAAGIIQKAGVSPFIFYVTSIDLLQQARSEFSKFLNQNNLPLKVGIIGNGEFDIRDVNVMTVQTAVRACGGKYVKFDDEDKNKLSKADSTMIKQKKKDILALVQSAKGFMVDECQHCSSESAQIIADNSINARFRWGLSVFPDSRVELRGGDFKNGFAGKIEDAWELSKSKIERDNEYEYKILFNVETRSWDNFNKCFAWKKTTKIIRHINNRKSFSIRYSGKESIKITEDHSIFRIKSDRIEEVKPNNLQINDILLMDNGKNFDTKNEFMPAIDILSKINNKWRVGLNLNETSHDRAGIDKYLFNQCKKRGYVASKFGGSLSLQNYQQNKGILPAAKWIYTESANKCGISAYLKISDLVYLIGFFIGDGWFDGHRIDFAVENARVNSFLHYIKSINKISVNPTIRNTKGKSKEIRISCAPLTNFLKFYLGNNKCYDKRIPHEFLFSCEKIRRQLLKGLVDSDGSRKLSKKDILKNRKKVSFTTTSENLKWDVEFLLRSLNISYTLSIREPVLGGIVNGRQIKGKRVSYQLLWSGNAEDGNSEKNKGNVKRTNLDCNEKKVLEVKEIEILQGGHVYDIECPESQSFVANGILVHNSATPHRDKGDDILIDACFGRQICNITASFLIEHPNKYLVRPDIWLLPFDLGMPKDDLFSYHEYYKAAIVENMERNIYISKITQIFEKQGRNILILCQQIEHGKILEELINGSIFLHGTHSAKQRKEHLQKMREGKERITIASSIFDEGIDCRALDTLILAGGGKSVTRALQRVGRVLRPYTYSSGEVKEKAIVVDIQDQCKYLSSHAKKRKKIYQTEPAFNIKKIKV